MRRILADLPNPVNIFRSSECVGFWLIQRRIKVELRQMISGLASGWDENFSGTVIVKQTLCYNVMDFVTGTGK
jgi:hypothetical protein